MLQRLASVHNAAPALRPQDLTPPPLLLLLLLPQSCLRLGASSLEGGGRLLLRNGPACSLGDSSGSGSGRQLSTFVAKLWGGHCLRERPLQRLSFRLGPLSYVVINCGFVALAQGPTPRLLFLHKADYDHARPGPQVLLFLLLQTQIF